MNEKQIINITPSGAEPTELVIRQGDAERLFQYQGFKHIANSTDSLIALVKAKSNQPNCVIAYNETGVKVILDDQILARSQDRVSYDYKFSQQYDEFKKILTSGVCFDQKEFIKFLQRREPDEILEIEQLIESLKLFKYAINITGDFSREDDHNYTSMIKMGDVEGTVQLPKIVIANIEVYNESGFFQAMELELEFHKPKSETEKPVFALTCPKLQRYLKAAVTFEIDHIKEKLPEYLIVSGSI